MRVRETDGTLEGLVRTDSSGVRGYIRRRFEKGQRTIVVSVAKNISAAISCVEEYSTASISCVVEKFLQRIMKGRPSGGSFRVLQTWKIITERRTLMSC